MGMQLGLAGQFWRDERGEVAFNDVSRAYFRRLWRAAGYELRLPMPYEHFDRVQAQISARQMAQALAALRGTALGEAVQQLLHQSATTKGIGAAANNTRLVEAPAATAFDGARDRTPGPCQQNS